MAPVRGTFEITFPTSQLKTQRVTNSRTQMTSLPLILSMPSINSDAPPSNSNNSAACASGQVVNNEVATIESSTSLRIVTNEDADTASDRLRVVVNTTVRRSWVILIEKDVGSCWSIVYLKNVC